MANSITTVDCTGAKLSWYLISLEKHNQTASFPKHLFFKTITFPITTHNIFLPLSQTFTAQQSKTYFVTWQLKFASTWRPVVQYFLWSCAQFKILTWHLKNTPHSRLFFSLSFFSFSFCQTHYQVSQPCNLCKVEVVSIDKDVFLNFEQKNIKFLLYYLSMSCWLHWLLFNW